MPDRCSQGQLFPVARWERCSGNRWLGTWRLFLELPRVVLPHRSFAEVPQEQGGRAVQGLGCATLCCSIGWEQGEECRWVAFTQHQGWEGDRCVRKMSMDISMVFATLSPAAQLGSELLSPLAKLSLGTRTLRAMPLLSLGRPSALGGLGDLAEIWCCGCKLQIIGCPCKVPYPS